MDFLGPLVMVARLPERREYILGGHRTQDLRDDADGQARYSDRAEAPCRIELNGLVRKMIEIVRGIEAKGGKVGVNLVDPVRHILSV